MENRRVGETQEVEGMGFMVRGRVGREGRRGREVVERDGWVGDGDGGDEGGGGGAGVVVCLGDEDGDGEALGCEELGELDHGHKVAHSRRREENHCVILSGCLHCGSSDDDDDDDVVGVP